MGEESKIEWCDDTANIWWGCVETGIPGKSACDFCYARTISERWNLAKWGKDEPRVEMKHWRGALNKMHKRAVSEGRRRRVFINSMSDLFEARDDLNPLREAFFATVPEHPWLDHLLLTKRPREVLRRVPFGWSAKGWPANVWMGVTVESEDYAWRLDLLREIPAAVRYVSVESMLGPVDALDFTGVHWVIVGGESGRKGRPMDAAWVLDLRDRCVELGIGFFFKQWGRHSAGGRPIGKKAAGRLLEGRTWNEPPAARGANGQR